VASNARSSSGRSTQAKSRSAGSANRSTAAKRSSSSSAKSRSTKASPAKARSRSRSAATANRSRSTRTASSSSSNGSGANGAVSAVTDTIGSAAQKATTPLVAGGAAAAGLIGGIVLGKRVLGPRRTVLGIPVARNGLSLKPMAKEVSKASKQIGRLTDELTQARKQAKKVGDALS
jgi:1-aminocyclopropane-1-carboxylate deaminase/D-cysteine desulfhydrase-like pyridoxal-dependent ACC family enzyme